MVKAYTIGMLEKYDAFSSVKSAGEYVPGSFGTVANGVFTAGANGTAVIMEVPRFDTAHTDTKIAKDTNIRVADITVWGGKKLQVSPANLPATFAKGDKLASDASGVLAVKSTATAPYLQVEDIIEFGGTGALVSIVTK